MLEATKCAKGDDHDAATKGMNYYVTKLTVTGIIIVGQQL